MLQLRGNQVLNVTEQLLKRQNYLCAICGLSITSYDKPVLDHDHDTGVIRGVLHNSCNGAEGRVKIKAQMGHRGVSPYEYLIKLGKYLELHKTPQVQLLHPLHKSVDEQRILRNKKARLVRARKKAAE